jgi:hypothetical protein
VQNEVLMCFHWGLMADEIVVGFIEGLVVNENVWLVLLKGQL